MYKCLLVVSDTALCKIDGKIYGFGAVVKELHLLEHSFKRIIWIGSNHSHLEKNSTLIEITAPNVKTILLPKMGGKSIWAIIKIIYLYPYLFFLILFYTLKAQVIHTRLPSHPAFVALLISFLFRNKIWWNKFAGSWSPETLPFYYKLQRKVLLKAKHSKVAINGFWNNQPSHCLSFENPCLTDLQIENGLVVGKRKTFEKPFTFVFIGRIDATKGVDLIIEALKNISLEFLKEIHFIGDSAERKFFERECGFLGNNVFFHGLISTEEVHSILKQSDFLLLPSKSEGFPKVIAEAACYGVIPIVSDVGSIAHYINSSNGYVWRINADLSFTETMISAICISKEILQEQSKNISKLATMFTFDNYKTKLEINVFRNNNK